MKEYKIVVKSWAGVKQTEITNFSNLSYTKQINAAGVLTFDLPGDHSAIQYLVNNAQVILWRRDVENGVAWHAEFSTLFKDKTIIYKDSQSTITATCFGMASILGWRHILWTTGSANQTKFSGIPAETIMKKLVKYNATADATVTNGRLREGAIATVTIEANNSGGSVMDWECAYENLLENLQKLALVAGGDFFLQQAGAQAWEFKFYEGFKGTDRTATVVFSLENRNMANPVYTKKLSGVKTAAMVGGQGNDEARVTETVTGNGYDINTNNVETFVDARNAVITAGSELRSAGSAALAKVQPQATIEFDVLQTNTCAYDADYVLGDLVGVSFIETLIRQVKTVTVTLSKDRVETIKIGLGALSGAT